MPKTQAVTFRVKDKGGPMGGREITFEAPMFDLTEFLKTPNADEFIKKAYHAAAKKIAREVEEKKNGSVPADLQSYEMIVARSLKFTKADVANWRASRDWGRISTYKDPEGLRQSMEKWLPQLAMRVNYLGPQPSRKVAEKVIAALADNPDPVAEYLFVTLSVERPSVSDLLEL
jgi:hypothetical protein